jgi:NitT/TauT family transport system substrate-binding protein
MSPRWCIVSLYTNQSRAQFASSQPQKTTLRGHPYCKVHDISFSIRFTEAHMIKRTFIKTTLGLALAASFAGASAQTTPLKFQLDWRFEGPSAFFLVPVAKGYFKDAKLDVTVDAGNGSGGAVNRVASGAYDIGFADLAALMEFHASNPDATNKPVAVMMVYNNTPASVMALKKSGIKTPADLSGKKLGAPVFDAGRKAFQIFEKENRVSGVKWVSMDAPLRETMLVRGDVDAITGFTFTSLLNLEARGVKESDLVIFPYSEYGVRMYGNAIIASPKLIKENPAALKAFLSAFAKGAKDVIADPAKAIETVKARDGIINSELETRRLKLAISTVVNSPDARDEGFGQVKGPRLARMASEVSDAFNTKTRVKADDVWNGSFLPSAKELDVLPKGKK